MTVRGALVAVTDDLFGIAERAKLIDPRYKIYYNKEKRRFEIYTDDGLSSATVLPFDRLDCRALTYLRKTRIERASELAEEIDRLNALAERKRLSQARSLAEKALGDVL